MIETGFDARVKINQIIENQLPEFLLSDSPKAAEFLKQYYISQEYQGGTIDIVENLDQYLKLDNFTTEVIKGSTTLLDDVTEVSTEISVISTKGFPSQYGLLKINNEIITYTGVSGNTFTGCIRGFCGITNYNKVNNPQTLDFSTSKSESHNKNSKVINLSALFLQEFYKKLKYTLTPGLENNEFVSDLDVNNFIKNARSFYQSKGTPESFRILFNVLYGEDAKILDLEKLLIKPSFANFIRKEEVVAELINAPANPLNLVGQTIKKSTDESTQASVSEVEILTNRGNIYYKLSLFVGYNDVDLIEGNFNIQAKTKVLENVSIGSSIISVDSTIGFDQSGTLISGNNKINYTDKSVNQFFGCSGINNTILATDIIRSDEYVYGYENGDITKKVELRLTGVLSKFKPLTTLSYSSIGENISIKYLGEKINNPDDEKTRKEIFANSWIYNTSPRYQVSNILGSTFILLSKIDKVNDKSSSSFRVGDYVDILKRGTENIVVSNAEIVNINFSQNSIDLANIGGFSPISSFNYDIRRKIKKTSSIEVPLEFGNNNIIADVQNLYLDNDNDYAYVASNSLPSYTINTNLIKASIPEATGSPENSAIGQGYLQGYDISTLKYSQISFDTPVPFISGDAVIYEANTPLPGLVSGETYYVEVISENKIRLYISRSFIGSDSYVQFETLTSGSGAHLFKLLEQRPKVISPQKILRKFPLKPILNNSKLDQTQFGGIGLLINGVEIISPKSFDKIYYGPLESIKILNSGTNYDVINPPKLVISPPFSGTTALANVVVSGSVKKITVDPQEFDLNTVFSVKITGGNGIGAILNPVVSRRYRELSFDGRQLIDGGGLDLVNETITFDSKHNFLDGEKIVYNRNGNNPIGVGSFNSLETTGTLINGSTYFAKIVNSTTIKLHQTLDDFVSGINTIGITTVNNSGIHKFRTLEKKTLRDIKVLNPGFNYQNRQLYVKPVGISTFDNFVFYTNHNFKNGDVVNYKYTENPISGISTENNYLVLKINNDSFRLCDAGIGTITKDNFERKEYVKFSSVGSGYHIFKYPDIVVNIDVLQDGQVINQINATPTVTGEIVDVYLYENGSGYGSNIINLKQTPTAILKTGKKAQIKPIIKNGRIIAVNIQFKGSEYFSVPTLVVKGSGTGASLRAVIQNEQIVDVIIVNEGVGYDSDNTEIEVISAGYGAKLEPNIRSLTVNRQYRFNKEILIEDKNLKYGWVGYDQNYAQLVFNENSPNQVPFHSPLIGWAYDGNPIYGPYGYSDPENSNSDIKLLTPSYKLNPLNIEDRPNNYTPGFFIEDYVFDDSGDLDQHNGRFCKTPDFPLGTYAYFVGVSSDTSSNTNSLIPIYPYFIGDKYRSPLIEENSYLNQYFDFNNTNLLRNTFPYKVADSYANNDFLVESNELINQISVVESVSDGSVDFLEIIEPGDNYKIGDLVKFNNSGTDGGGLSASVSSLVGRKINSITTQTEVYNNVIFERKDQNNVVGIIKPYHTLVNGDNILISGISTNVSNLIKNHTVNVKNDEIILFNDIPQNITPRATFDLYVSHIPQSISIGSSLVIDSEILKVLNIFKTNSVIRVRRSDVGLAHTISTKISILPDSFTIPVKTEYFNSKRNDKVYFNPKQSIGVGLTVGGVVGADYTIGSVTKEISIPIQSIYIPNHPFKTGQKVLLNRGLSFPFSVSESSGGPSFFLPESGNFEQIVYVINKSKDFIGLTTSVGFTTNTEGLFFITNGDDTYEYSLESTFEQVIGSVNKIKSTVIVDNPHNLTNGDKINLNVKPNLSVGIGQSSKVKIKYEDSIKKILVNPVGFDSSSISLNSNIITINSHGLKTGNKVFYTSYDIIASGISTGTFYIYKIDENKIQLSKTLADTQTNPPRVVDFIGVGGSRHEISLVNPQLLSIKNNDLVFDVSDSSLIDKKLKFYYDSQFTSEFIGIGNSVSFSISGIGTVGISSISSLTLKYSTELPSNLYYNIEEFGNPISVDNDADILNYPQILFVNSTYTGSYVISGVGSTVFDISLKEMPEKMAYTSKECDILKYTTTSKTSKGGVDKTQIIFGGSNYKKIPEFLTIISDEGKDAYLIADSKNIGVSKKVRILNSGFEYSIDNTLRPKAYISPFIEITNSNIIQKINVLDGGRQYSTSPNLVLKNPIKNTVIDDSQSLKAIKSNFDDGAISSVEIISPISGLEPITHEVVAINNSNSIGISSIISSGSGIVTCVLSTPILGFVNNIFNAGDKIFIENVEKEGSTGTGFNSKDYNYVNFDVISYLNTNPAILVYDMTKYTSNPGIAKTVQNVFASVVNAKNLPKFEVIQSFTIFKEGEQLLVEENNNFVLQDLYVIESDKDYIKVKGSYSLKVGKSIKGKISGYIASIKNIINREGEFVIDYSSSKEYGWVDDSSKLNETGQVISNNDYYQNLSYSVKSSIEFEKFIDPVNRLLHTTGMKNFADLDVKSDSAVGFAMTSSTNDLIILDVEDKQRVDVVRNFDYALDINTFEQKSKSLKLKNTKLTDYIECVSNRVLNIDNVSRLFSNRESLNKELYKEISFIENTNYHYLIQIKNLTKSETQISEVVVLSTFTPDDIFTFEKAVLTDTEEVLGTIEGISDTNTLRFVPTNPYDYDYDIKVLQSTFTSDVLGIGTQSVGFVNLTGVNTSVGIGTTINILSFNKNEIQSLFAKIELINSTNKKFNYVELFLDHDNTDTYIAEYYFDTNLGISTNSIGSFDASIVGNTCHLQFYNNQNNKILVKSKIVGFGTTSVGIGTYRFILDGQIEGNERSAYFESNASVSTGTLNVIGVSTEDVSSLKSLVRVSYGKTTSLHQVLMLQNDKKDSYIIQYPFLSIGSTSGIGTFGTEISDKNTILKFYPDNNIDDPIKIQSFSEVLYSENDYDNEAPILEYGYVRESISLFQYNGVNSPLSNRLEFDLTSGEIPIYAKTFNPIDGNTLDFSTGIFTINNHFFNTGEQLIYKPKSTFIGVGATSVGIGTTLNSIGILTDKLPEDVYVISINSDQFRLATRKDYAQAGIYVTFTSPGSGNAHQLEMGKKLEKTIISINGVVQTPIRYTPLSYNLVNNNGGIGIADTYFSISGISTLKPKNLLKIDDEILNVNSVGFGTTSTGPIVGFGTYFLVEVRRGFVGTSATSHSDGSKAQVYTGSFNIFGSKAYFTEPPRGAGRSGRNSSNLLFPSSTFAGRVYLRNDYTDNLIFDDISSNFTGIGQTYSLSVQGVNTSGIETGSGILFINDVFQTPTTVNNIGNNFNVVTNAGISSVIFTGITSENTELIISDFDVNQNQLPRGGLIVSLGSTNGLGYAPLVGASVTAIISGGVITAVGVGSTDIVGSGYRGVVSIGITDPSHSGAAATITATVGAGGTLSFNVVYGGSNYVNPTIQVPQPSYENLPVVGVSRLSIGKTTTTGKNLLITLEVGASSTTGIGSTLFEVTSFKITRPGYAFEVGDVFKPVGLVTDKNLSEPINEFELTVIDTFTDSFSAWQFGELDYIDSIKNLQNGVRKRFPLLYNAQLLSFEKPINSEIDLNNVLLIFVNGVIQEPVTAYQFEGGTSIVFTDPPKEDDKVSIFFYRGTRGIDSRQINVNETIKVGDSIQVLRNELYSNTLNQNVRRIYDIPASDVLETNIYSEQGIDEEIFRPFNWIKQKTDLVINGDYVYKSRDSIEPLIYPTAKIIKDVTPTSSSIFVDDVEFFNYEENNYGIIITSFDALIVQENNLVSAGVTCIVSEDGTIQSLSIVNPGSGYIGTSANVKISAPKNLQSGIGSIASATVSVVGGSISEPITITNPGLGYTVSAPPQAIISNPPVVYDNVNDVLNVQGFSGIVTGITTSTGTNGHPLSVKLFLNAESFVGLETGYPLYIFDTSSGDGIVTVDQNDSSIIGIGTTYLNNIYYVHSISVSGTNAEIISNVSSTSNIIGLNTYRPFSIGGVGKFSWGRLFNFSRSNSSSIIVSGFTVDSGLTTFPTIQRRGFGLRETGAIRKVSNI